MPLGNKAGTEIRTRLRLRSTVRGANNRLDVDAIVSYDRGSNAAIPMLGALSNSYTMSSLALRSWAGQHLLQADRCALLPVHISKSDQQDHSCDGSLLCSPPAVAITSLYASVRAGRRRKSPKG